MTLTQLRQFAAIVDSGFNITAAATRLRATQSGLSKQLKQFEDELGLQLFVRGARSLTTLTPVGERVLASARAVLEEAESIRSLAAQMRRETRGELHIATTHTQARYVLPRPLANLKRHFPQVTVHVAPGGNEEALARLSRGEAELAIISTGGAPPDADFALPLYRWEHAVLVSKGHPLTRLERPLELPDLGAHPIVTYESSRAETSSLRRAFAAAGVAPNITMTARDSDLIKTYVHAGIGVGILAEMAIVGEDDELAVLRADDVLTSCTTWLLLKPDRFLRDHVLELIALLMPHVPRGHLPSVLDGEEPLPASVPHWRDLAQAPRAPAGESADSSSGLSSLHR